MSIKYIILVILLIAAGCTMQPGEGNITFHDDLTFLKRHVEVIVLNDDKDQAGIIVVPEWQGRVMTSTASGKEGMSFGWINRELIASGEIQKHINVFGGEDRFWLGPEGGQYSIFFNPGVPFEFDHWFTPAEIDTEPFEIVSRTQTSARFKKPTSFTSNSGLIKPIAELTMILPFCLLR